MSARDASEAATEGSEAALDFTALAQEALSCWEEDAPEYIAVDTETEGVAFFDAAFCVTLSWQRPEGDYAGFYLELSDRVGFGAAQEILSNTDVWVFHNAKFDLQKLILAGVVSRADLDGRTIHDTEAIAHLTDPNADKKLKRLAMEYLDWDDTIEVERKSGEGTYLVSAEKYHLDAARRKVGAKKEDGYAILPREVLVPYAVADALMTAQLFDVLYPRLEVRADALKTLYAREQRLSIVLLDIEAAGMRVDMDYVNSAAKKLTGEMYGLEQTIKHLSGRDEFKDHHQWIKPVLEELGVEVENTQAATLEDVDHPIIEAILGWRKKKKMWDYFHAIQVEQRDSILHPSFRQHGTKTGRMSSGKYEE